jgi:integrase
MQVAHMALKTRTKTNANGSWTIEGDSVSVNIRPTKNKGRQSYTISWREKGRSIRRMRTSKDDAERLAEKAIHRILKGGKESVALLGQEGESLQRCKEILKGIGYNNIESATLAFANAINLLPENTTLIDAVKAYKHYSLDEIRIIKTREAVELFLPEKKKDIQLNKWRDYVRDLNRFCEAFDCNLNEPKNTDLRDWIESLTVTQKIRGKGDVGDPLSNTSRENILRRLNCFYNWCQKSGYLPRHKDHACKVLKDQIFARTSRIWKDQEKEVSTFTPEQVERIINECPERVKVYAMLLFFTGMRPSEVKDFKWEDYEKKPNHIFVKSKKTMRTRYVPIPKNLKKLLAPYAEKRDSLGPEGKAVLTNSTRILSSAVIDLGIADLWPPDVARHSYHSYRLAVLGDPYKLANETGNSVNVIHKHYKVPFTEEEGKAYFSIGL